MVKDMEFAADENVIAILGKGERKGYAETLLQYQISRRSQIAGNKFAENIVKERILSIMKYNKKINYSSHFAQQLWESES